MEITTKFRMALNWPIHVLFFFYFQWQTARVNLIQKSMAIQSTARLPHRKATLQSIPDSHPVKSLLPEEVDRPVRTIVGNRANSKVFPQMETTTTQQQTKLRHQGKPFLRLPLPPPLAPQPTPNATTTTVRLLLLLLLLSLLLRSTLWHHLLKRCSHLNH